MDKLHAPAIAPALLLKLSQAYRSMPELDLALFSILKNIQSSIGCASISIWLLDESKTELECTHTVGSRAGELLGSVMRARKFTKAERSASKKKLDFEICDFLLRRQLKNEKL